MLWHRRLAINTCAGCTPVLLHGHEAKRPTRCAPCPVRHSVFTSMYKGSGSYGTLCLDSALHSAERVTDLLVHTAY